MSSTIKKIFSLLSINERRKLYWLLVAMIVMAIMEVAGVSSIMPFMSVLSDPDIVSTNKWLNWLYIELHFTNIHQFLFFLGIVVLIALVLNNGFTACITWLIFKFTWQCNHNLSKRLLETYLYQPYQFFLNRNSSDLGKNILDEVRMFITFILLKLVMILKNSVLTISIVCLLLFIDPLLAIIVSFVLGSTYAIFFAFVNKTLNRIGKERTEANELRFKIVNEALSGIKEIKVLKREQIFLSKFATQSLRFANTQAMKSIISQLPKYALEVIAFGGILLIVLYYLVIRQNVEHIIPLISLYTFAAYRLMPALQAIFTGISEIRFTMPALDVLEKDLKQKQEVIAKTENIDKIVKPLKIKKQLELQNAEFTYLGMEMPVIQNFTFNIPANTTIGFAGPTGSGKTTIADIILGLLPLNKGQLVIDNVRINDKNLINWQKNIGYVSQDIFIYDDTVANNIAFGILDKDICWDLIEKAAQIANLHEFIMNELPERYNTLVGERGVRLSGGQRQRIGIARAIYHNPDVLVLDEATSALDGATESAVMESIQKLSHKKTIIMIAHRLTTLKNCDIIFFIEGGRVTDKGTYKELMKQNIQFQIMAKSESHA
jgi:ABC-type multidrug transport system fused ATPase/permease subunit